MARIDSLRRTGKCSANRITIDLRAEGVRIGRRTITRRLPRLDLGGRRFLDSTGACNRKPRGSSPAGGGHMVHLDVKKVGRVRRRG